MKILSSLILLLWSGGLIASQLTFHFNSPSFSGIGQSSHYLTVENLETSRKNAIIAKAESEERRLQNELNNTAIEIFRKNLETLFYSTLSTQIIDNIFGVKDDQQNDGSTVIDGYKIVWTSTNTYDDEDGITVKITNISTGELTYDYTFPYQEELPDDDD
ncbi:MAG: curli assembly protein CsgF [Candidatus Pacebacteria bacterium]|nr:curli assembly protein CsgF [Candidatus Paceibacterota bacterium]